VKTDPRMAALHEGRAFVDLTAWRKLLVHGSDAARWLNDLLSAELEGLGPGDSRRSLLLSPTGRIRADLTVARLRDGFLLVQDREQPTPIHGLLEPYVLSSDVRLDDRTDDLALFAFPGSISPDIEGAEVYRPSALGEGSDVVLPIASRQPARSSVGLVEAGPDVVESWRIERGAVRFGVDLGEDSLPHEAALESTIAYDKGCFLGQEAVAKVRNLGHPRFVVLSARSEGSVHAGESVLWNGSEAGTVTSAVPSGDGSAVIVRIRWEARDAELLTDRGERLRIVKLASGPG
jgi:folate-binding protein YgfZ